MKKCLGFHRNNTGIYFGPLKGSGNSSSHVPSNVHDVNSSSLTGCRINSLLQCQPIRAIGIQNGMYVRWVFIKKSLCSCAFPDSSGSNHNDHCIGSIVRVTGNGILVKVYREIIHVRKV